MNLAMLIFTLIAVAAAGMTIVLIVLSRMSSDVFETGLPALVQSAVKRATN